MVQWINESMDQWRFCGPHGSMKQRSDESMNQWSNEATSITSQWSSDSTNINESMHGRVSGWLVGSMEGWMDAWMDEWVSYKLCWATSSLLHWGSSFLSYFFPEQPLTWATSSLSDPALSCLAATSSVASTTHFFSSSSCFNAFSNLQVNSRLLGASRHHWCFPAHSRANLFRSRSEPSF